MSSHERKLEFRFGGKHLDLSQGVTLRGAAFNEGLRPAVAAMGASSPVGSVQSVTRVLERSNEEGNPLTRILCSGLSAHAVFRCASSLSGSSVARRSRGRNKALHGSLPVVWVTSRHGNAKRHTKPHSRARTSRTHGVSVRRYVIAEVGGRRCGPEKRWRFTLLTRKSDASVAGGLGRRGRLVTGKPVESARRAKQCRQSDRGGKVAGSMKDGAEPEGAITCRWKALRVVDIV